MDPFLGEIRIFGWNWAPKGWALCNGASLPVQQNIALFSLLGVTFGGTANQSFNLPDLQGRTPIAFGTGADGIAYQWGDKGGAEAVELTVNNLPPHIHSVNAFAGSGDKPGLTGNLPANVAYGSGKTSGSNIYAAPQNPVALAADTVANAGGTEGHPNMQPYTVVNFCIATLGLFPPRD